MEIFLYLCIGLRSRKNVEIYQLLLQLQLYTAKSQYSLHKAGASPERWQSIRLIIYLWNFNENIK